MDEDIESMSQDDLKAEVIKLRAGIRKHRDSSGHDLCWYVPELWGLLPEKVEPQPKVPPTDEFLDCCRIYRHSLLTQEKMDAEREKILALDWDD